jgi:hypothetical protein
LGNNFHVKIVAFHLCVIRSICNNGIRVLSLFSRIGVEVAKHNFSSVLNICEKLVTLFFGTWTSII